MKKLDRSKVKKILVVSLSNIGDVILTFPVIDILREEFPGAELSVVVGPKAVSLFDGNPNLKEIIVFDKHQSSLKALAWVMTLRKKSYDLVVDLRNTAIPILISSSYRTPLEIQKQKDVHMKEKHLSRLRTILPFKEKARGRYALFVSDEKKQKIRKLIQSEIGEDQSFVVVAPGAANHQKRWAEKGYAEVCDQLISLYNLKVIFVGDDQDRKVAQRICALMNSASLNLCGQLSLTELAELLSHAQVAVVNDSAPMHLASYLDVPVVAIFGPSDPFRYGPWSRQSKFVKSSNVCPRCKDPKSEEPHICMVSLTSEDVLKALKQSYDRK